MIFEPLSIPGAFLLRPEPIVDERGFFARMYCRETFAEQGLNPEVEQSSISFNSEKHTLRGMHLQAPPHQEAKLVRCTRGRSHHVVLDLRKEAGNHLMWAGVELSAVDRHSLYVPEGVAHGFITLEENTEIFYQMSTKFVPGAASGFRWNDPAFGIEWPHAPAVISGRDSEFPDYQQGPR